MQRSLSLATDLDPKQRGEDDDDNQSYTKSRSSEIDEDEDMNDEDEESQRKLHKVDENYSPRKACAEEVATFERSSSIPIVGNGVKPDGSPATVKGLSPIQIPEIENSIGSFPGALTKGSKPVNSPEPGSPTAESSAVESDYIRIRRAILAADTDTVKSLVSGVADPERQLDLLNHVSGKDGFTPLMIAVSCEEDKAEPSLVQFLLEKGARKDLVDRKGNTCLHWAAMHGQSKVLRDLVDDVSDIGKQNHLGNTPLHLASRFGRVTCCEILLSYFPTARAVSSSSSETGQDSASGQKEWKPVKEEKLEKMDTSDDAKQLDEPVQTQQEQVKPMKGEEGEEEEEGKGKETKPTGGDRAAMPDGSDGKEGNNAEVAAGEEAMKNLLAKKQAAEALEASIRERRRVQKAEILDLLKESAENDDPPHQILLMRNADFETAFESAAMEVPLEDIGSGTPAMVKVQREEHAEKVRREIHRVFYKASGYFRTLILHHMDCFDHIPYNEDGRDIWEAPERLHAILQGVSQSIESDAVVVSSKFAPATREMLIRAHSENYIDFVCKLEKTVTAPVPFTPLIQRKVMNFEEKDVKKSEHCDTSFSPGSLKAGLSACGAVCHAIDRVAQKMQRNAFCVVRPPGHHAGINGLLQTASSCGFCIFNNVMVGAMHALDKYPDLIKRIAIVDFDVHHGNGTEEIVAKINREAIQKNSETGASPGKPPILFFSSHVFDGQRPGSTYEFYPGSGQFNDTLGNIINAPMQPLWRRRGYKKTVDGRRSWAERFYFDHFGRTEFRRIIKERLLPSLRSFDPDLILLSAGFDASRRDVGNGRFMGKYCSGFDLQQQDYMWVAGQISQVASVCCDGRLVSVLEGGYGRLENPRAVQPTQYTINRSFLARNCVAHISGLVDPRAKMEPDSSDSEDSDDGNSLSKDTEEKLNQRRSRTRRPPKRFEGQEHDKEKEKEKEKTSAKSRRRRRAGGGGDSSGDSDDGKKSRKRSKKHEEEEARIQDFKRNQALNYLKQVKAKFSNNPSVYKQFLYIMGNFKSKTLGVDEVILAVKSLFGPDQALIEGFNAFLPPGFSTGSPTKP